MWASALVLARTTRRNAATRVEHRPPQTVFPTYYRCNTEGTIRQLAHRVGLDVVRLDLFNSFPFFRRYPLGLKVEAPLIRLTNAPAFRQWRSNIVGCLRKRGVGGSADP